MSKYHNEQIECPVCGAKGEFRLWESVNVDLNPELKEKVFSEELFVWECPECGQKVYIPFSTLYHDMNNKFMISFQFDRDEESNFDGVEMPAGLGLTDDYTYRTVYGIRNLKEKIFILEKGLNDVVLERLKYGFTQYGNTGLYGCRLLFLDTMQAPNEANELMIGFLVEEEGEEKKDTITIPMQAYYQQKLAVDLDERMKAKDWACVDSEWISMHLKTL